MKETHTSNTFFCRCLHVRHATLLLAIAYLIFHLLGMYFLVYLSVNLEEINNSKKIIDPVIRQVGVMQSQDFVPVEAEDDDQVSQKPILRVTNVRWWISVFIINDLNGTKLSRYDLNMGMMFEAVNSLVALMALVGVLKRWPGFLVPFLLNQVLDIVFAILLICGVDSSGSGTQPNFFAGGVLGSPIASAMADKGSQISIVLGVTKIFLKLCLLRIVLMCINHLRDTNNRIFRDERHEKWATRLLQASGNPIVRPPTYEDSELDVTSHQPNTFVTTKVTDV